MSNNEFDTHGQRKDGRRPKLPYEERHRPALATWRDAEGRTWRGVAGRGVALLPTTRSDSGE